MRAALRVAAMIIAIIGAIDGLVVNFVLAAFKRAQDILGGSADPSHGFIGLLICLVAFISAFIVLRSPAIGGVLLLACGIGFFIVAHWWALLAAPQMIVAGAVALMDLSVNPAAREPREPRGRMPAPTA